MGDDSMRLNLIRFVICIAVCQLAGVVGSIFTTSSVSTWYAVLAKPAFTPPDRFFAPVWITLYTMMGIAAFLVWRKGRVQSDVRIALTIFVIHLAFNILWPVLFFGLRSLSAGLALGEHHRDDDMVFQDIVGKQSTADALFSMGQFCCCS